MTAHNVNSFAPSLAQGCDTCEAWPGSPCVSMSTDMRDRGKPLKRVHPARRRAADAKRTAEVRAVNGACENSNCKHC
jgi:hypothetical protein